MKKNRFFLEGKGNGHALLGVPAVSLPTPPDPKLRKISLSPVKIRELSERSLNDRFPS